MESTTTETRDNLINDVNQLKSDVAKITSDARAHATAQVEEARRRVKDTIAATQAQLAAHPFTILGAGLLLGYIFGRRRRRS